MYNIKHIVLHSDNFKLDLMLVIWKGFATLLEKETSAKRLAAGIEILITRCRIEPQ